MRNYSEEKHHTTQLLATQTIKVSASF